MPASVNEDKAKAAEIGPSDVEDAKPMEPAPSPTAAKPAEEDDELNSEDLELSDEEETAPRGPGGAGSDVDEDWGSWE